MDSQQNKLAFVTGVSSGIGEALAKKLLSLNYRVNGIGRSCTIEHANFSFQNLDLSNTNAVKNFEFEPNVVGEVLLVNNAGIVGEIGPIGDIKSNAIEEIIATNVTAPLILCNKFIQTYLHQKLKLHIINISSGAGKRAIDGWATYCSSKAALDLFSCTIQEEMLARKIDGVFVHAVAPGVVDTKMQGQIRSASPQKFFASQRFHDLKNNNELASPETVAESLVKLIKYPTKTKACVIGLSDIQS